MQENGKNEENEEILADCLSTASVSTNKLLDVLEDLLLSLINNWTYSVHVFCSSISNVPYVALQRKVTFKCCVVLHANHSNSLTLYSFYFGDTVFIIFCDTALSWQNCKFWNEYFGLIIAIIMLHGFNNNQSILIQLFIWGYCWECWYYVTLNLDAFLYIF